MSSLRLQPAIRRKGVHRRAKGDGRTANKAHAQERIPQGGQESKENRGASSRHGNLATNAMGFVQLFFLTTRSMFTIPRNSFQTLSAFYLPDVTLQGYTECLALFDGESTPRMVRIEDAKVDTKNTIKFKYKYSSHHSQSTSTTVRTSSMILSIPPSINAHHYAINPHHHPPQNPIKSRPHRHPPMDSQR